MVVAEDSECEFEAEGPALEDHKDLLVVAAGGSASGNEAASEGKGPSQDNKDLQVVAAEGSGAGNEAASQGPVEDNKDLQVVAAEGSRPENEAASEGPHSGEDRQVEEASPESTPEMHSSATDGALGMGVDAIQAAPVPLVIVEDTQAPNTSSKPSFTPLPGKPNDRVALLKLRLAALEILALYWVLYMYICMYRKVKDAYKYIYTCIYICMYIYIHVCRMFSKCIYTYTYVYIYMCIYRYMYIYVCVHLMHTYTRTLHKSCFSFVDNGFAVCIWLLPRKAKKINAEARQAAVRAARSAAASSVSSKPAVDPSNFHA